MGLDRLVPARSGEACLGTARAVYSGMASNKRLFRWQHQSVGAQHGQDRSGPAWQGLFTAVSIYWVFIGGNTNMLACSGELRKGKAG